jgi:hypothetical protein
LSIPSEGFDVEPQYLTTKEIQFIARNLLKGGDHPDAHVNSYISTHETSKIDSEKVEKLRASILEDYGDTVFNPEIIVNPPVRGPFGYAYIPLKPNAKPMRQKTFSLHGERQEAYRKVAQGWLDKKYVEFPEKGKVEWLVQGFVVPKKKPGEYRGIVDMRGPNSQTLRGHYVLPLISDLLVRQGANQLFSILDLKEAFHQQPLHPDSRHITCTFTPFGIVQWRVNVMGLMNASGQFQQMMNDRLLPVQHRGPICG